MPICSAVIQTRIIVVQVPVVGRARAVREAAQVTVVVVVALAVHRTALALVRRDVQETVPHRVPVRAQALVLVLVRVTAVAVVVTVVLAVLAVLVLANRRGRHGNQFRRCKC